MFLATELTGDAKYQQIAISQAEKSSKTHIRPDFTTNHVVNFDPTTGDATAAYTHQGGLHGSHGAGWRGGTARGHKYARLTRRLGRRQLLGQRTSLGDVRLCPVSWVSQRGD